MDTSVAVPALDSGHAAHQPCLEAVRAALPAITGHAAFETHSVLTRMPGGLAVDAPTASALIRRVFPVVAWLDPGAGDELRARLGVLGITGGGVYDALVAETARLGGFTLLTRDRRALPVYEMVGVKHRFVGP